MFNNQKISMQTDHKFTASYSDDWDDMPAEPSANNPARVALEQPTLDKMASTAEPDTGADLALAPKQIALSSASAKGSGAAAATTVLRASVAIPMPQKLGRYPGLLARSAVFRIGRAGAEIERSEIACYGSEYGAVYEGPRLGMRDKSIWEYALRAAKEQGHAGVEMPLPTTCIAAAIGGGDSGPALARIGDSLLRLSHARIDYRLPGGCSGSASLLGSARKTPAGWRISFDPGLVALLGEDKQFEIDTDRRKLLSSDLAKWLHDFMSTHKSGYAGGFKLRDLAELCGWRSDAGKFPSRLREALGELSRHCPALVKSFEIQGGKRDSSMWRVHIDKGPEPECFEVPAKKTRLAKPGRPRRGGVSL